MDMKNTKELFPVGCIIRLPDRRSFIPQLAQVIDHFPSKDAWALAGGIGAFLGTYGPMLVLLWQDGISQYTTPDKVERLPDNPYREIYLTARVMTRMVGKSWEPWIVP